MMEAKDFFRKQTSQLTTRVFYKGFGKQSYVPFISYHVIFLGVFSYV